MTDYVDNVIIGGVKKKLRDSEARKIADDAAKNAVSDAEKLVNGKMDDWQSELDELKTDLSTSVDDKAAEVDKKVLGWKSDIEAATDKVDKAIADSSAKMDEKIAEWQEQVNAMLGQYLRYDEEKGEYANIEEYFFVNRDGKRYSAKFPHWATSTATKGVKTDDNAGLVVEPSTNAKASRDDYRGITAFSCNRCNGYVSDDGMPHVTAIEGDSRFEADGSNGDVWVLAPVLYWSWVSDGNYKHVSISDSPHAGYAPAPGAVLPTGKQRPFMLYPPYIGGKDSDGKLRSASGMPLFNSTYSANSSIDLAKSRGAGYSGKTVADNWYMTVMPLVKYADQSIQTVYRGCSEFYLEYKVTVAQTDANSVVISASNAANLPTGCQVMVGTSAHGSEILVEVPVLAKETVDDSNVRLVLDTDKAVTTAVGNYVSTAPYRPGYCDGIQGTDGYPNANYQGKEPCKIQNIEMLTGCCEVLSGVILKGSPTQEWYVCKDSANYATSLTSNYKKVGQYTGVASNWSYPKDYENAEGLFVPTESGGSSSTGLGDGYYLPSASSSLFECLGVGRLSTRGYAGLFCVYGTSGLGDCWWYIAGRLSATGRCGG